MKTTVIDSYVVGKCKLVRLNVEGVDNVQAMSILTQRDDLSRFSTDDYFGDDGIITGCSYISAQYCYGSAVDIAAYMGDLFHDLAERDDLMEESEDLMEIYFLTFKASYDKLLLVTNAAELYCYMDEDIPEPPKGVKFVLCGSITDDNDIESNIMEALWVHPKTKGFKVPGSDFFEYKEGETPSYSDFEEYRGTFFSCSKSLKKDPEWFDFFNDIQRLVSRNSQFDTGYASENEIGFILEQAKACESIPDNVQLVFKNENSHKFYNIEINNCAVIMEYGGVGKNSTVDEKDFQSYEEAKKFLDKKVISKIKSGYVKK